MEKKQPSDDEVTPSKLLTYKLFLSENARMFLFHVRLSPLTITWKRHKVEKLVCVCVCLCVWSEVNFQTLLQLAWANFKSFPDIKNCISNKTSPGDVVVVYLVFTDVPVALQPVETVECLPVVVGERLVKATVDSVLNDEHSEITRSDLQRSSICSPSRPEVGAGQLYAPQLVVAETVEDDDENLCRQVEELQLAVELLTPELLPSAGLAVPLQAVSHG